MPGSPQPGEGPLEDLGAGGGETRRPALGAARSAGHAEAGDSIAAPLSPLGSPAVDGGRLFDDGPLVASRSRTSGSRLDELATGRSQREMPSSAGAERTPAGSACGARDSTAPAEAPSSAGASAGRRRARRGRVVEGGSAAPPVPRSHDADGRREGRGDAAVGEARSAGGGSEDDAGNPEDVARQICLRALTGASRTRKQLADLLQRKEVPEDAASAVLDRLTEVGLIDDAAFAAAWVRSRQSGRGLARRALSSELRAKGVAPEIAAAALEEVDPQDEWDTARRLVARKLPGTARLERPVAERRLIGMLARKGYGGGLAGYVVREALDDRDAELLAADEAADDVPGAFVPDRRATEAVSKAVMAGEVGEGQARALRQRGTGPRPDWSVDDTP